MSRIDLFEDWELDQQEENYLRFRANYLDSLKHQINMLQNRVNDLERAFGHYHVANPEGGNSCISCGYDLRDFIHIRENQ